MNESYTPSAKRVLELAQVNANGFRHQAIGTEHLLLALVSEEQGIAHKVLAQFVITPTDIKEEIERLTGYGTLKRQAPDNYLPYSPKAKGILTRAAAQAELLNSEKIGTEHILLALLEDDDILSSRILDSLNIDIKRIRQTVFRQLGISQTQVRRNAKKKDKVEGTPTLDGLARNLNEMAENGQIDPVIGRQKEVTRVIQILSRRTKNNPVLLGEPGVGKTAIEIGRASCRERV